MIGFILIRTHIEWINLFQYPAIPLYCSYTCIFFLFLYEGKHTSMSFPIFDPQIERTTLLNSCLISCIFLSTVPTKLAAAGCSQTKLWSRMWSMDWIMFFHTSFNVHELYTTSVSFVAFSILSWIFVVAGDRNKPVSLNQLTLCCKGSGVSKSIFWGGFWGESKITLLSANFKRLEVGLTSSNPWLDSKNSFIRRTHKSHEIM